MGIKLPVIAGVVWAGGSAVGLGIYLNLDRRDTVSTLVFKETTRVLLSNKDSDSTWNEAWKKYRDANRGKTVDSWKIKNFSSNIASDTFIQGFKEACSSRYKDKVDGVKDPRYLNMKEWCTRPKKIFELLAVESGVTLLSKDGLNNDSKAWDEAWANYKKDQPQPDTTNVWGLSDWAGEKSKSVAPNSFKEKCKTQSEADVNKGKEDELYIQVKKWCTFIKKSG